MKKWVSFLAGFILPASLLSYPNFTDMAYYEPVNFLLNPGFESGKANWTASGGTFTTVTSGSNLAFGGASGSWTPSASSQTLSSTLQTIPNILKGNAGCGLSFFYKGSDANLNVKVLDGSASVIGGPTTLSTVTNFTPQSLYFTCPTSGQLQVVFTSTASSATIYLDQFSLGARSNNILQSQFISGSITAPAFIPNGSTLPANGLYLPSANTVGFSANTTRFGSLGSSGNWILGSRTATSASHQINIFDTSNSLNAHLILSAGAASGTNFVIVKDRVNGKMTLSGSTTGANGARLELNGQSSGNANATVFYQGNTLIGGSIDANTKWIFADPTSTQTHQMYGALNPTLGIIGVTTNSNAAAGTVGEYVESVISSFTNYPAATTVWGDMTTISLTAGDWDITGILETTANGATVSAGGSAMAISVNSGATTTDQVAGSNQVSIQTPSAGTDRGSILPNYRLALSGTTTIYFKLKASYSVATPQFKCRISARRER